MHLGRSESLAIAIVIAGQERKRHISYLDSKRLYCRTPEK